MLFALHLAISPELQAIMAATSPMHLSTLWKPNEQDPLLDRHIRDTVVLSARAAGIEINANPDAPAGTKWFVEQALETTNVGPIMGTQMLSLMVGGRLRVTNAKGELIDGFDNESVVGHISEAKGFRRAVTELGEKIVDWIVARGFAGVFDGPQ